MVDEIFDRQYQAGRTQVNAAIGGAFGRLTKKIHDAFEVLVRIEYQSPWNAKTKRIRFN